MPSFGESFSAILDSLSEGLGPAIPPASTGEPGDLLGVLFGSLLSRTMAPRQVRSTWETLREAGLSTPEALAAADLSELVEATRSLAAPHKSVSPKTLRPLHLLARWIVERGGLDAIAEAPTESLREELRMIPGIGSGSADALLLYGLKRPVYPVDRATYRIFVRHGWIDPTTDYEEARSAVESPAYGDPEVLANLASWLARVGELYCRTSVAKCDRCPLKPFLPDGGLYEPTEEGGS